MQGEFLCHDVVNFQNEITARYFKKITKTDIIHLGTASIVQRL